MSLLLYLANLETLEDEAREELDWQEVNEIRREQAVAYRLYWMLHRPTPKCEVRDARRRVRRRELYRVVATGFIQVLLVAWNTFNIAHGHVLAAVMVGFLISLVWTINIKSIVLGNWTDRIIYSLAAASGTATGMLIPRLLS